MYNSLIYPIIVYDNTNEIKQCNNDMNVDDYYHNFYVRFQEKCIKSGLTIDIDEYVL